jgi:transcriptional regulator with XRE-family HTH domain
VIDRSAQQLQKVPHMPSMPPIHSPLDDLDKRIADVGEFIKSQRETARMSVRRLADLAGVSNPYLSQIERGLRKPSAEILQQIAKALQISAETLYVRAGFLSDDADSGDNAVRDAIARDAKLTPEQRHALLNVYESFVASTRDAE